MDFDFLYDPARDLLSIGYDVGERRRDPSWYDLLASEARLTSFLLIAEGQVPQKHWFALGRLLTSHGGDVSLISWSGSMFEYLMPRLFLPSYENTLLEQACQGAVSRQIDYGRQRHVPWGISESCYNAVDMNQVYQYRAFGVPGLGFKRGLAEDLVVAPYATALALTVVPRDACRNLQALASAGFLGDYGLYEAIDYTPSRVLPGTNHAVVRCFMAHHQGMSLLALAHALLDGPMQRRFLSDPLVRTTELLLQERVPKHTVIVHPRADEGAEARTRRRRGGGRRPSRVHRPEHAAARGPSAVERSLPRHGHPRGRGIQPLARSGGDALARGRDVRRVRHVHLPARPRDGQLLVDRLSADAKQGRALRGGLRAGARRVPQSRSRHRSAHRDQRVARRRRRDPPRHPHQSLRSTPARSR